MHIYWLLARLLYATLALCLSSLAYPCAWCSGKYLALSASHASHKNYAVHMCSLVAVLHNVMWTVATTGSVVWLTTTLWRM